MKKVQVWLDNQPWWPWKKTTAATPSSLTPKSSKMLRNFIFGIIIVGLIISLFVSHSSSEGGTSLLMWAIYVGALLALYTEFRGFGNKFNVGSWWKIPLAVTLFILVALSVIFPDWWHATSWKIIALIGSAIMLIYTMKKYRVNGSLWVMVGLALIFFKTGCSSTTKTASVSMRDDQKYPPIDTVVHTSLTDSAKIYTGPNQTISVFPIRGHWPWKKTGEVYCKTPSGVIYKITDEGVAVPFDGKRRSDSLAMPVVHYGLYTVWSEEPMDQNFKTYYLSSL